MIKFMESTIGQIIARNGILAIILAYSLWANHGLVERLFGINERVTHALLKLERACVEGFADGRE